MPKLKRFAMVTPNFYPRTCGVSDFTTRLSEELVRFGHETAIFSRRPAERHPEAPRLEVHGLEGRFPTVIARNAIAALRRFAPTDVVIHYTSQMWDTWRFGSPALIAVAHQARRAGAKVTLVAHELYVPVQSRPDLLLAAGLQRLQFAALLRCCDSVFVTTGTRAASIEHLCRSLGVRAPAVIRVGPSALPISRRPRLGAPGPRIGFFSTAATGKRFDVVLESFSEIARQLPGAELVLMGDLGPSDRPGVRKIIDDVGRHSAKERIRVTGKLTLPDIATEISNLDVYLFPVNTGANTRSSTLPTALGSGLPVVAINGAETDVDLFRDRENIAFANDLSASAFAATTLELLRDPSLMASVGEGARRLYAEHLSWQPIAQRFLEAP
jgi:glycosyltransferase involved in cell wall biosynthesis